MKAQEFIDSMEAGQSSLSNLYSHFRAGDFTPANVLEYYRVRDSPRFIELTQAFTQGKLFKAQTENFDAYILGTHRHADKLTLDNFLSFEDASQQRFEALHQFVEMRIYSRLPSIKEQEDMGAIEKLRSVWISQNQRNGWNWRG